jgi:hypothetical protein
LWTYITYDAITATFEGGFTTDFVQIRNWIAGVYSPEVDTITMSAFDPSNALLGTVISSGEFISLAFPDIAKVVFDDVGTGYLIDEFQFNVTVPEPVPEPASPTLFALAVLVTVLLGKGRLSGA